MAGAGLRIGATFLRALQFCLSAIVLGIFSYYLAVMHDDNMDMPTYVKAVEGISGGGALYGVFAVLLTCCLGGVAFFGFLAVILDLVFVAGFAVIAYYTRDGVDSCTGTLNTPLGSGEDTQDAPGTGDFHFVCRLETVAFGVAVANIVLFLITALLQVALVRQHRREKKFGPSPANNYTSGGGKKPFWSRGRKAEPPRGADYSAGPNAMRPSQETAMTGSTIGGGYEQPKYGQQTYGRHPATNY